MILFYTLLQLAVVNSVMNKCIFVPVIQRPNSKLQTPTRDSRIGPRPVNESLTVKTWQKNWTRRWRHYEEVDGVRGSV